MTIASQLAEFVNGTRYEDLPRLASEHAKIVIASTVASAAMGSDIGSSRAFREISRERGGTPESTIWFDSGPKLPSIEVAQTNAIMSDAAASDDTDLRGAGHLGTVTSATALAIGERAGASGQDVIEAIVLGYEIAGRIGSRTRSGEIGFHAGVNTIFGATVAAGKLLKLDNRQMTHALALAATSIGGIGIAANTSWAREYDACLAAGLAVTAAMAAGKGFTAEERIFEMPRGYFEVFHGQDVDSICDSFGKEWGIVNDLAIKLVPGAWTFHSLAEAAATAAKEGNVAPNDVESIIVHDPRYAHMTYHPTDLIGVAHSLPYLLACAVADGEYSWRHSEPDKIADATIGMLQDKVKADEKAAGIPRGGGAVTVVAKNGKEYYSKVEAPRGSGPRGIEWSDIDGKFRQLLPMANIAPAQIEKALGAIHEFEGLKSTSALTDLLRKGE